MHRGLVQLRKTVCLLPHPPPAQTCSHKSESSSLEEKAESRVRSRAPPPPPPPTAAQIYTAVGLRMASSSLASLPNLHPTRVAPVSLRTRTPTQWRLHLSRQRRVTRVTVDLTEQQRQAGRREHLLTSTWSFPCLVWGIEDTAGRCVSMMKVVRGRKHLILKDGGEWPGVVAIHRQRVSAVAPSRWDYKEFIGCEWVLLFLNSFICELWSSS